MKFDVSRQITHLDGTAVQREVVKNGEKLQQPMQAKDVIVEALLVNDPSAEVSGAEKLMRFKLAQRVHRGGMLACTVDEAKRIHDVVSRNYGPLVYGQIHALIEGDEAEPAEPASG